MKPFRSFLYIFIILSGFCVVSFFMLDEAPKSEPEKIETDTLQAVVTSSLITDTIIKAVPDSIVVKPDTAETKYSEIQFLSGDTTILDPFFETLKHIADFQSPLRIMYYGDSQIEGDRITSTMRRQFQKKFGGAGIGFIAPENLYNLTHSFTVEHSDNLRMISYHDVNDSLKNNSLVFKEVVLPANQEAWFKIKQIRNKENKADYLQLKMFYRSPGDFAVVVKQEGKVIYQGQINATTEIRALNFNFSYTPPSIELFLQSTDSLVITGFSLETKSGIQFDNIALRGLSYPPFSMSDTKSMQETMRLINPGLCILHFGVNIAPSVREKYTYYRSRLVREIRKMKELMPGVPILVVGISDMARKENGEMVSYPNIEAIKKVQKEAARNCGCAFWDLEEFMGGVGSMVEWVNADPRLGQKDFVHFTNEGTEKIGEHLSELIISEYEKYLERHPEE